MRRSITKSSIGLLLLPCCLAVVSVSVRLAPAAGNTASGGTQHQLVTRTSLETSFVEREQQRWAAIKRGDSKAFAEFLAPDYLFVSGNGVFPKTDTVKMMARLSFTEHTLADFRVVTIDPDTTILTYRASGMATFGGQEPYAFNERHGSVWVLRDAQWLCVYHHYSPIPKR